MTTLIPNYYRYKAAKNFTDSFASDKGIDTNYYYAFAGNHQDYSNTAIPLIHDNVYDTTVDVYRNIIFGKLIKPTDVSLMIKRIDYETGISYDMYDDKDPTISSKNFYVIVDEGGYFNAFKCLNNNNYALSTVTPSLYSIGTDGIFYSSVDGYTWKYMYSIDITTYEKFSTEKYVPLVVNNSVVSTAIAGAIDSIKIEGTGAGYSNYIQTAYFTTPDIHVYSNVYNYGLSGAAGASPVDDFYKGCILGITSGTGAGQYRIIESYEGTSAIKYVVLDNPFTIKPDNTSIYSVYPGVYITGDQTETINATAWAYVNPSGNTISRVEIIAKGAGYKIATANVFADVAAGVTAPAIVRPILPPPGGNGSNPANELYCSAAAVSVKFTTSESNTIPSTNKFRQLGLMLNPTYSNVSIEYSNGINGFVSGETVYSFYPQRIQNHMAIDAANNIATTAYGGQFDTMLEKDMLVYITDGSTFNQIFVVNNVINSNSVEFTSASTVDIANSSMYTMKVQAYGDVIVTAEGQVVLENVTGQIKQDAYLLGNISSAYTSNVTSIMVSDVEKQFDTFVGAYKYIGTVLSGTFDLNETVTQIGESVSSAVLHSVETVGGITEFFFTNQDGIFNTSNTIYGTSSGATASLTDKYVPEIVFGSGKILYLENVDPITRNKVQSETFKLVFEF